VEVSEVSSLMNANTSQMNERQLAARDQLLTRLDEAMQQELLNRKIHNVKRTKYLDVWDRWIGPARYRETRFTWSGTWALKNSWDDSSGGRNFVASLCGWVALANGVAGAVCGTWMATTYWEWGSNINRAIRNKQCVAYAHKKYGLQSMPGHAIWNVRCVK
jgi:hypothetical protein